MTWHLRHWIFVAAISSMSVATAQAVDFTHLELRAQLTSQKGTTLSAEMPGRVQSVFLEDGARFQAGDLLLAFDCRLQEAQLEKAQAELMAAENVLSGQRQLAALNAVSLTDLRNSEAEVIKAQADVRYLNVMMSRCQVAAPYDGRVVRYAVREHQSIQSGQELVEIIDNEALTLEFRVPTQWLSWFIEGFVFEVRIDDTGHTYPVVLQRTAARVDPISQTVLANGMISGQFPELLPGMSGTVLLNSQSQAVFDQQ